MNPPLTAVRARLAAARRKLNNPDRDRRRRRREDLVAPLATIAGVLFVVVAVLSYGLLRVAGEARSAATEASAAAHTALENTERARRAVTLAVENTERIAEVERKACKRLQRVRTSTNRNGAIIYVVLGAVSANVRQAGDEDNNAREYRALGRLPEYDPDVDCDKAADPAFEQPKLIPFADLPRGTFLRLLPRRVVDRILGPG